MKKFFIFLMFVCFSLCSFAQNTVNIYVAPNGTGDGSSLDNPTTIQNAMTTITNATVTQETDYQVWALEGTYDTGSNVTILQQENKNIQIQAYSGTVTMKLPFKIDGNARSAGSETILLKNLTFNGNDMITPTIINANRGTYSYVHNLTVESCTFTGNDNSNCRAINFPSGNTSASYNVTLKNCIAINCEGFYQNSTEANNMSIENCKLVNCKRGFNISQIKNGITFKNTTITGVTKYAIRLGQSSNSMAPRNTTALISHCNISGNGDDDPLIVMRGDCPASLLLEDDTLTATATNGIAIQLSTTGVNAIVKSNSTLTLDGKMAPQNFLTGENATSRLKLVQDGLYQNLTAGHGYYAWTQNYNSTDYYWHIASPQYVYPAGVDESIDNAVVKGTTLNDNHEAIEYYFTSVPDAVDFMTQSSSTTLNGMACLGLDEVTINILKDNTLKRQISITDNKNVTLLDDQAVTTRDAAFKENMITIAENATLTIGSTIDEDTLVFDGANVYKSNSIISNKGTLNLAGNVIFKNNHSVNVEQGAAIHNEGTLTISGDVHFNDNQSQNSGAIFNKSNSSMQVNGKVAFEGNQATQYGGAVGVENGATLTIKENAEVNFTDNVADKLGGALCNSGTTAIDESATVNFTGNESKEQGGAIVNYSGGTLNINGTANFTKNKAKIGSSFDNRGVVTSVGNVRITGDTATKGGVIYNTGTFNYANGEITENVVKYTADDNNQSDNGVIVAKNNNIYLTGGHIYNNHFVNESGIEMDTLPASLVYDKAKVGHSQIRLSDSVVVDTIRLILKGKDAQGNSKYYKNINIANTLTAVSEDNPIVLLVDSFDVQIIYPNSASVVDNYRKFKPAADTLTINKKGWLVRKPQISIDGIYLLQARTKYSDYGIVTNDPDAFVPNDMIYVAYTQQVDAHGNTNTTKSDSTILKMDVTYGNTTSHIRQKIAAQENGSYSYTIPFNSNLWDEQPSAGQLDSGQYEVKIDTLAVYTLGVAANTEYTLNKDVNIPHITIDTLNFLLAGAKFSDYHHCGVGATTNDGDGADVVPGDEIYVEYTRTGAVDTAYILVGIKGNNQNISYSEGTPAGTHFTEGCGSFRSFLNNTGIGQFVENTDLTTPAQLNLADDSTYKCSVIIRVKADGEPYFSVGVKSFNYTYEKDRTATFALDTFNDRDENYNNIGITLTQTDDSLALNYPSVFSVAKANELGMIDQTDKCLYVVLTADPVDTVIRVESSNQAISLGTDIALNSSNYSTAGYGVQEGKLLMAVKISEPVQENGVIVPAINFSTNSMLQWCSVIGENTGINNPYKTFRTLFKVSGQTANDTTKVTHNQMSYRNTGVSGVMLHASTGQASYMFHPEDYTIWPTQDQTSGLELDGKVWLALYVARPNATATKVYNPASNTPYSTTATSIVELQDDLSQRVTATEAVNYYPVGTCADYATKDYSFYYTGDAPYLNNYLYWFDDNDKLLSVQKYNVSVKKAPTYTVTYQFNGGGATCNTPYAAHFADTTYIFGRKIIRPDDPFKCGHLFMDWYEGNNQFLTIDSFQNIRNDEAFGIRANHNLDAHWKYFVTLSNPHDTAVVADYSMCDIPTRSYVWEPTESTFPYIYTFHTDYLGKYYREYTENTTNCNVRFDTNAFTEIPVKLPVGQTSNVTWKVTDMCGTQFSINQQVNVKFPPCGTDNYNPHLYPFTPYVDSTYKAKDANGNLYETVRMGCDCWTKENLKTLNYAQDNSEVVNAKAYLNDEANVDTYGRLYTWYSAVKLPEGSTETTIPVNTDNKPQGICPNGWYLPSEEDFARMSNLTNIDGASASIKEEGINDYWLGNETGTNATGFSALPAGFYNSATNRYFNLLGDAYFWTSSTTSTVNAPCCALTHSCPVILITDNNKGYGYSIRCIKYQKFDY